VATGIGSLWYYVQKNVLQLLHTLDCTISTETLELH
jgi:hypothetical protein